MSSINFFAKAKYFLYFFSILFLFACSDDETIVFQGKISNPGNYKLTNATLLFYRDTTATITFKGYADTMGVFKFSGINQDYYYIKVTATGYVSLKDSVYISGNTTKNFELTGSVSISGSLTDASNGDPISGASLEFFRVNETTFVADTLAEIRYTVPDNGAFTFENFPTGRFKMLISKSGYNYRSIIINCEEGQILNLGRLVMVPPMAVGKMNIVLNWGQNPANLDIYLFGPSENGLFICNADNPNPVGSGVELIHQASNAYGPETMQINSLNNGTYILAVCNKSNLTDQGAQEIYDNRAKIEIFNNGGLFQSFLAPQATTGNAWKVFKMVVKPGLVQIDAENEYVSIDSLP